jgi:hypothetical protein
MPNKSYNLIRQQFRCWNLEIFLFAIQSSYFKVIKRLNDLKIKDYKLKLSNDDEINSA